MAATVTCDYATVDARADYLHLSRSHINIRGPHLTGSGAWEGPGDKQLLADIGTKRARCFVRLEQWAPNPWPANPLDTDPNPRFTIGDSWISEFNDRGTEIWLIHEGLVDLTWMTFNNSTGFTTANLDTYEDLMVAIVTHIKTSHPALEMVEMLNEPEIIVNGDFDGAQIYELLKRAVNVCTRVNALSLPGPTLKTGGPAMTYFPAQGVPLEEFIDAIEADSANWDANVKPHVAFIAFHSFANPSEIDRIIDADDSTEGYGRLDALAAASTHPTMFDGIDRVPTAFSRSGDPNIETGNPTGREMAQEAAWYAVFHEFCHHYESPAGDRIVDAIMFAKNNYKAMQNSLIRPEAIGDTGGVPNVSPSWASVDGIQTPVYNLAAAEQRIAEGGANGIRVDVSGSGADWYENVSAADKRGISATAVKLPGSGKIWAMVMRSLSGSAGDTTVTLELNNLDQANIDTGQPMAYTRWQIDENTSNVANGTGTAALTAVETDVALTPGPNQSLSFSVRAPAVHLIELTGTATGAALATPDTADGTGSGHDATAVSSGVTGQPSTANATGTGHDAVAATGGPTPGRIVTASTVYFN